MIKDRTRETAENEPRPPPHSNLLGVNGAPNSSGGLNRGFIVTYSLTNPVRLQYSGTGAACHGWVTQVTTSLHIAWYLPVLIEL